MENRSDYKILVVDDTPELLDISLRVLRKAGFLAYPAESGKSCIKQLEEIKPDLVLLDVILPDINGKELCKQIKQNPDYPGMHIILLSSFEVDAENIAKGLDDGADGYIIRPVRNIELIARIEAQFRIIRAERELSRVIKALKRINNIYEGREEKMVDLKKEINRLLNELGQDNKYRIVKSN